MVDALPEPIHLGPETVEVPSALTCELSSDVPGDQVWRVQEHTAARPYWRHSHACVRGI